MIEFWCKNIEKWGLKEDERGLKQVSHKKALEKANSGRFATDESRVSHQDILCNLVTGPRGLQVAKMSSQNSWLGLATCKSSEWVAKISDTCFSTQLMLK